MAIVITDEDARRLLSMAECIDAMRVCFRDFATGRAVSLPRVRYTIGAPDPAKDYYANVHVGAAPSFGMACVRAGTHLIEKAGYDRQRRVLANPEPVNWSVIILYDMATSEPVAFMHESHVSGMRVGATAGVAVDAMARPDSHVLGLYGTGRQALAHCEAICTVRPIREVRVYSPNPAHVQSFIARARRDGVTVAAAPDARAVAAGADIVCCTTNTTAPVLKGAWVEDGQMVISVANSDPTVTRREVDEAVFARADAIVINDWQSVHHNRQVELLEPMEKGLVAADSVHLLGDVVAGKAAVTAGPGRVVYYKNNTGLAMQFAAAGAIIWRKLSAEGTSRVVPREWLAAEKYGIG